MEDREIITAKEAFERVNSFDHDKHFKEIMDAIKRASAKGSTGIHPTERLSEVNRRRFRELGYIVKDRPDGDGYAEIYWDLDMKKEQTNKLYKKLKTLAAWLCLSFLILCFLYWNLYFIEFLLVIFIAILLTNIKYESN